MFLDEELHEGGVPLHGGVVERRPARLRLAVDERVPLQQRLAHLHDMHTFLGGSSFARFCQQEFGEFPRPAWAVDSYSSGPPAGGTP